MPKKSGKSMKGKGFVDFFKKVGNWIKDNKIISSVAKAIPHPASQVIGNVAGAVGLGKKRKGRKGKRLRGGASVRF